MKGTRTEDEKELYRLCIKGTHEQIAALLERGVNPNVPYIRKEVICALLPDELETYVDYPIHHAAANQSVETVKLLVENGADPKVQDFWKNEPLYYAAGRHDFELIKYLVEECGNDPGWQNDDGIIPYWCERDYPEINKYMVAKAKEFDPDHEEWYEEDCYPDDP